MAGLGELLRNKSKQDLELGTGESITPEERELMSFRERERQDLIKKELFGFRKKNAILNDNQGEQKALLGQKSTIFAEDRKQQRSILDSKNIFNGKKNNLLTGGGGLW